MAAHGIAPSLLVCRLSRPSSPGIPAISHAVPRRGGDAGGGTGPALAVLRHGRLRRPVLTRRWARTRGGGAGGGGGCYRSCRNDRGQKRLETNGKRLIDERTERQTETRPRSKPAPVQTATAQDGSVPTREGRASAPPSPERPASPKHGAGGGEDTGRWSAAAPPAPSPGPRGRSRSRHWRRGRARPLVVPRNGAGAARGVLSFRGCGVFASSPRASRKAAARLPTPMPVAARPLHRPSAQELRFWRRQQELSAALQRAVRQHGKKKTAVQCECLSGVCSRFLLQAYPVPRANQAYTVKALTKLMSAYGTPQVIESDQGTHFMVQRYSAGQKKITLWRFHLPYNPTGAGLIERYNGILKAALKTDSQSLQGWTKRLYETLQDLNERPRDGRPSALRMLQTTWATPLRIQITGTDHQDIFAVCVTKYTHIHLHTEHAFLERFI
ncbi:uncharacterized protein LOC125684800 [Lagopus muta]|uniref:uncharacterized protein LOC125684800 n=1 Tax=Lagopus muta TaxID=64668 RepID=UPI0020A03A62|nr:uncharacterized protein LOC125684800 [Lagopus muta]